MKQLHPHFTRMALLVSMCISIPLAAQVNLQSGLIAYLPMDGNGTDLSGNGNHATPQGSQTFPGLDRFGTYGASTRFIGENGQAKMTFGAPLLNDLQAYTLSYWFLMSEAVNGMNLVGQDNVLETAFYTSPSPGGLRVWHPASGGINVTLPSPWFNNWRHLLVTGNSTQMRIYINGTLVHSANGNFALVSNNFHCNIGGHVVSQTSTGWMRGSIDELRIYNRMVTHDEVAALAAANHPALGITNPTGSSFCAGSSITVQYSATGGILSGNEYQLQMSNASGSFNAPVLLARIQGNALAGTITTEIPTGTPSGVGYRFRLVSTRLPGVSEPSVAVAVQGIFGDIPSGYTFMGRAAGRNYYLSNGSSGGGTAQNTAVTNGGHLATVYNAEVDAMVQAATLRAGTRLFIGLNDIAQEGHFVWRNKAPVDYLNWEANQPDNWNNNEHYVEVRSDNGRWNDIANTKSQRHVMELSPAGPFTYYCIGDDIQLNARTIGGATYAWTGPGGFSSAEQNPIIANGQGQHAGTYTLTVTAGGCTASESVEVQMNLLPNDPGIAVLSGPVCPGTAAQIGVQNSQTGYSYRLVQATTQAPVGAAQNGNGQTLTFSTGHIDAATAFRFLVENTQTGCSILTPPVTAQVLPHPPVLSAIHDEVCNSGQLQVGVTGAPTGATIQWFTQPTGGSPIPGIQGSSHSFTSNVSTTYYVSATDANGCVGPRVAVTGTVRNPLSPPVDLNTGLILHYKFDGNFEDQSGNGYNGTPSGNITFQDDRKGHPQSSIMSASSNTSGGSNFINAGNPALIQQLPQAGQMTISFWMRQTQTWFADDGRMPLVNKWNDNNFTGWYLGLWMQNPQNMSNRIRWRVNGSTQVTSQVNVPMFEWHHVVCTYNGSQLRVYQNGVLTGTANHSGAIQNVGINMFIGRFASGNGGDRITYRGGLDELRIYNRALNPSEVLTLYNDESVAFVNTPFCDGQGSLSLTTFNFPGATYQWTGPNGFSSNQQNPTAIANADSATYAGVYTLSVTDGTGCTSPPQQVDAIIHPFPPTPAVANDTICGSGNALLQVLHPPSGASYRWYTQPSGGSPISGQTGATLAIGNVTTTQTRYVAMLRNGCEGPRSMVQAIYVGPVNTNLSVMGSTACQGQPAAVSIGNAENGIQYQAIIGGTAASQVIMGNGTGLTIPIQAPLAVGINNLSIAATAPGCNSVTLSNTAQVEVLPHTAGTHVVQACGSYTWINGITYTQSNSSATVHLINQYGCDSLVTLQLTIHQPNSSTQVVHACGSYTWINGVTYTQNNNTATHTLTNQHGCDSLVTLQLTLHQPTAGTQVVSACNSYTWINGVTYTSSTSTPTAILSNQYGCDSLVTLHLTILPGATGTQVVSACDSYTWIDGITYTASNQSAVYALPAQNGCDSLITLHLTIHHSQSVEDAVHACEAYEWIDGNTYTESNSTAAVVFVNQVGCDSTVVLNLTIAQIDAGITNLAPTLVAVQGGAVYQWIDCSSQTPIAGEVNQAFTAFANGAYAVQITYEGCTTTSDCAQVTNLSAAAAARGHTYVYPNPGFGIYHVRLMPHAGSAHFAVRTAEGRLMLQGTTTQQGDGLSIDLRDLAPGVYHLELRSGSETTSHKIVKL